MSSSVRTLYVILSGDVGEVSQRAANVAKDLRTNLLHFSIIICHPERSDEVALSKDLITDNGAQSLPLSGKRKVSHSDV